jgi:iron complex outermembrane receptor protein
MLASFEGNVELTPAITATSVTGFYQFDQLYSDMYTNSNASLLASTSDYSNEQFTQEVRVATDFDFPVNVMVGGFYQDARLEDAITVTLDVIVPAPALLTDVTYRQRTDSKSVFGEATLDVTDQFDISIGARYTDEEKRLTGQNRGGPLVVRVPVNQYSNTSIQATARYQPSDDLTIFASYREGFIAGGFDFNPAPPAFGPNVDISFRESTANGFEVGVNGSPEGTGLRFSLAAYRYKYIDMQLAARDAVTLSSTTLNAGAATVQGAEADVQWRPPSFNALRLSVQAAYTDASYDEFIASCFTGQSIAEGCNLRPNPAGAFTSQDLAGQRLVRAPKFTGTIGALYDLPLSSNIESSFSINASYSSSFEATVENDPRATHPSYWILNASYTIRGGDNWTVAVLGRNLTNELTRPNSFHSPLSGGRTGTNNPLRADLFGIVGNPREVAVQLRYNF